VVGSLFFWPLLGLDPVPGRVIYPFRMMLTFLTLPFHAFLGITIMSANKLIAEDWYTSFGRSWPPHRCVTNTSRVVCSGVRRHRRAGLLRCSSSPVGEAVAARSQA